MFNVTMTTGKASATMMRWTEWQKRRPWRGTHLWSVCPAVSWCISGHVHWHTIQQVDGSSLICSVVIKPSIGLSLKEKNSKEKKDKNLAKNTAIRAETERHEFDKRLRKEHGRNRAQRTQIKERSCHAGDLYLWNYNLWDCIHCFLFVNIWRIKNDDLQTKGNI